MELTLIGVVSVLSVCLTAILLRARAQSGTNTPELDLEPQAVSDKSIAKL